MAQGSADGHLSDPDYNRDLSNLVPHIGVGWDTPPSFNEDPPGGGDGGGKAMSAADQAFLDGPPIRADLTGFRSAEQTLLNIARNMGQEYEALRQKVLSDKDTVFGQQATVTQITGGNATGNSYNGAGTTPRQVNDHAPSPIRQTANEFAGHINPAQEKVLWQIANTLEIVGQYIGAINRTGQSYGHADRSSAFPEPPNADPGMPTSQVTHKDK